MTTTAVLLAALALTGCGNDDASPTAATGAATGEEGPAEPGTDDTDEGSSTNEQPGTDGSTPTDRETVASSGDDLAPGGSVLVAAADGVHVVAPDGTSERLGETPAGRVRDDGLGGFVMEAATSGPDAPSPAVLWQRLGGDAPVEVLPEALSDGVVLHDVGLVDGEPTMLFVVSEDGGQQQSEYVDSLQRMVLPDGDRERLVRMVAFESGIAAAALGGDDTVAVETFAEASSDVQFLDLAGEEVTVAGNPVPDGCFDDETCPVHLTMSQDGARLAWIEQDFGDPEQVATSLVVVDRDGTNRRAIDIAPELLGDDVAPSGVDLAGDVAVVGRADVTTVHHAPLAGLRVDLDAGDVVELPVVGRASVALEVG